MRAPSAPLRRDFSNLWAALAAVGLLLGLVAYVGWIYFGARHPGWNGEGVDCVQQYERAANAHDSAVVDARRPYVGSAKPPYSPTCGVLRKSGELRR